MKIRRRSGGYCEITREHLGQEGEIMHFVHTGTVSDAKIRKKRQNDLNNGVHVSVTVHYAWHFLHKDDPSVIGLSIKENDYALSSLKEKCLRDLTIQELLSQVKEIKHLLIKHIQENGYAFRKETTEQ